MKRRSNEPCGVAIDADRSHASHGTPARNSTFAENVIFFSIEIENRRCNWATEMIKHNFDQIFFRLVLARVCCRRVVVDDFEYEILRKFAAVLILTVG